MKLLLTLLLISISTETLFGQADLQFDKRLGESVDRWVVLPKKKDSTYTYAFIYIDMSAGFTADIAGSFQYEGNGKIISTPILDNGNYKVRLDPIDVKVAHAPLSLLKALKIDPIPEWLKHYKSDTSSIQYLYRTGYLYNHWNECSTALNLLEKAKLIDINYPKLAVELAFSYNCLGRYDEAVDMLKTALKNNPTDAYTHKELIYSQVKSGKLDDAAESCRVAIKVCTDTKFHAENLYNLLYTLYEKKEKEKFKKWILEGKKWMKDNPRLLKNLELMDTELFKR